MEKYRNKNGDSGISGYEIGGNFILIEFSTGSIYEYTYSSAGTNNIEMMKNLAALFLAVFSTICWAQEKPNDSLEGVKLDEIIVIGTKPSLHLKQSHMDHLN